MKDLKNLHIIIAEDDEDDAKVIYDSFSKHPSFTKISMVKNGKELIKYLEKGEEKPHIILTDINMPMVSGIEALEVIFKNKMLNHIPAFTYSSTSNPIYEAKSKELGSLAFLIKPYSLVAFDDIPNEILYILENRL